VLLGAINATVSVFYYLVAVKHAYLLEPEGEERPIVLSWGDKALCYGLSAATVLLGFWPTPVYDFAARAVQNLP